MITRFDFSKSPRSLRNHPWEFVHTDSFLLLICFLKNKNWALLCHLPKYPQNVMIHIPENPPIP